MKSGAYLRMTHIRDFIEANRYDIVSIYIKYGDGNVTNYEKNENGKYDVKKRKTNILWEIESRIPFSGVEFGLHYNNNLFSRMITVMLYDGTRRSYELHRYNNYINNTIDKRTQYLSKILLGKGLINDIIPLITVKYSNQLHLDVATKYKKYLAKDQLKTILLFFIQTS